MPISLSFYGSGYHTVYDLLIEDDEKDQHRDGDYHDVRKQQIETACKLSFIIVQRQLYRGVLRTRQEIQGVCKVVKRLHAYQNNERRPD